MRFNDQYRQRRSLMKGVNPRFLSLFSTEQVINSAELVNQKMTGKSEPISLNERKSDGYKNYLKNKDKNLDLSATTGSGSFQEPSPYHQHCRWLLLRIRRQTTFK
jgi:hypothetical protein